MWIADKWKDFEVLDCGNGEKVERWGKQVLVRPDPQAIWPKQKNVSAWRTADASYHRSSSGGGKWNIKKLPSQWDIHYRELTFHIKPMNFKHTGLFPEQAANWDYVDGLIRKSDKPVRVPQFVCVHRRCNTGGSCCRRQRLPMSMPPRA